MTQTDPPLTIKQQARRWVLESQESPALHAAAMRWCAQDPEHRREFDIVEAALAGTIDPAARTVRARQKHRRAKLLSRVAIAASVAAILLFGAHIFSGQNLRRHADTGPLASSAPRSGDGPLVLTTRTGEVRQIALADGSIVTLDSDSRLTVSFRSDRRDITLDHGRAIFSVAHDRSRPFIVATEEGTTTALGTRFSVERRSRCQMDVVLYTGHVAVTPPCQGTTKDTAGTARYLNPGQRIRYSAAILQSGTATVEPAPVNDEQWITGVKSYDNETIGAILAEVNLYSNVKLIAASPDVAEMRVSAELHIRNPQSVAKHLSRALGLTLESRGAERIILKK
ncbi:FecR family protein [Novosphingobium sp. 11B]